MCNAMAWREQILRRLARGDGDAAGRPLDAGVLLGVVDRIEADPALVAELAGRDDDALWSAVLALYEEARAGPR